MRLIDSDEEKDQIYAQTEARGKKPERSHRQHHLTSNTLKQGILSLHADIPREQSIHIVE